MFGTIKGKFRGGDLHSYEASVPLVLGEITLSLCEAVQKFHPCNKFSKSCCKCLRGCKTNRYINEIQCSSICHNATVCTKIKCHHRHRATLLSPADRALLDTTAWLSDMHMEAVL